MKTSLILTINNRTPEVSQKVADSFKLPGNKVDEVVVVLDRAPDDIKHGVAKAWAGTECMIHYVALGGEPGWLGPARAWNAGFKAATGDLFYCISSEVVQEEGNVETAEGLAADGNTAVFGACHNSKPENLVVGADPGLLVSSKMARPLGFIVCMPADKVKNIGGFDEAYMDGFWFDDDDFFLRMWNSGVDFLFEDKIHGTHLHHERPDLNTLEGQAKIATNRALMIQKHGRAHPWNDIPRITSYGHNQVRWMHI